MRTKQKFIVGGRKNFAKILVLLMGVQEQGYLHTVFCKLFLLSRFDDGSMTVFLCDIKMIGLLPNPAKIRTAFYHFY
jgi:hypothetical protein